MTKTTEEPPRSAEADGDAAKAEEPPKELINDKSRRAATTTKPKNGPRPKAPHHHDIHTPEDFRVWLEAHRMTAIPLKRTQESMGIRTAVRRLGGGRRLSEALDLPMAG